MVFKLSLLASIFLILTNLLAYGTSQPSCFNNGNYTSNSTYSLNFDTLLSSLPSNVDYNGFYNASVGQNQDEAVYAYVLCRGDVQLSICRRCIQNATRDILRNCPNYKQAVQYIEFCTLRYSNESMFGILETNGGWFYWNSQNASSPDQFMEDVGRLLDNLRDQAASGGSLRKVAAGEYKYSRFSDCFCSGSVYPGFVSGGLH